MEIDRRGFIIAAGASALVAPAFGTEVETIKAVDTVPHIYDTKRPIGNLYAPNPDGVTAQQLKQQAPNGVVGTIVIEASPWLEDNLWLLDAVNDEPFVVGVVGNLPLGDKIFPEYVERYSKHPLFLGIRHGNLWPGHDLPEQMKSPAFVAHLRLLAQADLTLDLANPRLNLLEAAVRVNDAVPELTVIVDHLGGYRPTMDEWVGLEPILREYAERPNLYCKLTGLSSENPDASPAQVVAENRDRLDRFYDAFGRERTIGGGYFTTESLLILNEYLVAESIEDRANFFWKNSVRAYKWTPRNSAQSSLG
ncbi:MAG TPA: amidohydrolase family protein [Woeseiaceae bacterium]|nr:amidohydrolase family protein [Woeseiaceae bacterium]